MSEVYRVLKCPYCDHTFKTVQPDSWHSAYSFDEPVMSSLHGEVKHQQTICRNPKCAKNLDVYWFAAIEYFNQM